MMHFFYYSEFKDACYCMKSVHIRNSSGPYFPAFGLHTTILPVCSLEMREYTDLKISKCRHFSRNVYYAILPSSLASFTDRICIITFK